MTKDEDMMSKMKLEELGLAIHSKNKRKKKKKPNDTNY